MIVCSWLDAQRLRRIGESWTSGFTPPRSFEPVALGAGESLERVRSGRHCWVVTAIV